MAWLQMGCSRMEGLKSIQLKNTSQLDGGPSDELSHFVAY